jgi:hypothetical protein
VHLVERFIFFMHVNPKFWRKNQNIEVSGNKFVPF